MFPRHRIFHQHSSYKCASNIYCELNFLGEGGGVEKGGVRRRARSFRKNLFNSVRLILINALILRELKICSYTWLAYYNVF